MAEDTIKSIRDRNISHIFREITLWLNKIHDDVDHPRNTESAMEAMVPIDAGVRSATSNLIAWPKKSEDEEQSVTINLFGTTFQIVDRSRTKITEKIHETYPKAEPEHQSMSNGSKKRNLNIVSDDLWRQEEIRMLTKLPHRRESLNDEKMGYGMAEPEHQSMSNGRRKRFASVDLSEEAKRKRNQICLQSRRKIKAKLYDDPTERGINNNGKITHWKCEWERMTEMLLSMEMKNELKANNIGKTKASQQVLCHRNQIKMQWPIQSDLLVTIQVIPETDRKCKDAVLAEANSEWRLLLIGETIEKLDRHRSEFFFPPPCKVKDTATDDKTRGVQSKFRDLENQLYDNGNDKVECEDFPGLEQELKKTSWGKIPDYLESIAIQIEKDRGKTTDIFHIPTLILLCAAIKEMKDFSVGDLDLGTLKKWSATLNYAKKYGFQVGFADNLLRKNLLAYFAIQNLPKSAVII